MKSLRVRGRKDNRPAKYSLPLDDGRLAATCKCSRQAIRSNWMAYVSVGEFQVRQCLDQRCAFDVAEHDLYAGLR
jgi:hypothetical protein